MVEPTIQDADSEKLSGRECARGNLCENPSIQADRIDTDRAGESPLEERIHELSRANLSLKKEIAARKLAEEKLNQTIRELQRSNHELQEFAFVASHDLQAPLRKMQTFAGLLEEECEVVLNEECRDYIRCMKGAAGRMRDLIDRLLEYSRVNSGRIFVQQVDLGEVIREVVSDIKMGTGQEMARVEVNVDDVIGADPFQMRQLFQNLIHNAIKFRGSAAPVVKVSAKIQGNSNGHKGEAEMIEISIEDNGIGFNELYLDRVFAPFQRLHPVHEYEGTGMGLPICKRIVERHHGELTARSKKGEGAVFIVRLPVIQPREEAPKVPGLGDAARARAS